MLKFLQRKSGSVDSIIARAADLRAESDSSLRSRSSELRYRARCQEPLGKLAVDAFALVQVAAERTLGQSHYETQLRAGLHLVDGNIVEMETGQGKTLTATLPLYTYALVGKGCHLATSNDYLANRDAQTMRRIFELLGLSVGVITEEQSSTDRRSNYACDITYGTASQFGFDFLRDRLRKRANTEGRGEGGRRVAEYTAVHRELFYILADEADALLIDDASTPLIIGAEEGVTNSGSSCVGWAAKIASDARELEHYTYHLSDRHYELTDAGRAWARSQIVKYDLNPPSVLDAYDALEKAILVSREYHRDRQYIVRDGSVLLINNATGRLGVGREWQDGIHQAIQASEELSLTEPKTHAAKLTMQGLFLAYQHMGGMTGTAYSSSAEFRRVYKRKVVCIAPREQSQRRKLATRYFSSENAKWAAICEEIIEVRASGRPVLVGTRSIRKSHTLSAFLNAQGVDHTVLNAKVHEREAEIIANAGQHASVTIATNMAGRGTDIRLSDRVRELGGLHVILSEHNDSPRHDRQLLGRCGRQGEKGTFRQFVSLDDEILDLCYGARDAEKIRARKPVSNLAGALAQAQMRLERKRRKDRLARLYFEKRRLRSLLEMGNDPLLEVM